jgi:hypothetical protein
MFRSQLMQTICSRRSTGSWTRHRSPPHAQEPRLSETGCSSSVCKRFLKTNRRFLEKPRTHREKIADNGPRALTEMALRGCTPACALAPGNSSSSQSVIMIPMGHETDTASPTMPCAARTQVVAIHYLLGVPVPSKARMVEAV